MISCSACQQHNEHYLLFASLLHFPPSYLTKLLSQHAFFSCALRHNMKTRQLAAFALEPQNFASYRYFASELPLFCTFSNIYFALVVFTTPKMTRICKSTLCVRSTLNETLSLLTDMIIISFEASNAKIGVLVASSTLFKSTETKLEQTDRPTAASFDD